MHHASELGRRSEWAPGDEAQILGKKMEPFWSFLDALVLSMMHGFQQIVAQAECRYNFVVHGLSPLGDEMAVSPPIWRKRLMDSISSNLGYYHQSLHSSLRDGTGVVSLWV